MKKDLTKTRTINSYLKQVNTKKETMTYGVVNKNPDLGNPQNVTGFYNKMMVFSSPLLRVGSPMNANRRIME
jgi:hypothetical protein